MPLIWALTPLPPNCRRDPIVDKPFAQRHDLNVGSTGPPNLTGRQRRLAMGFHFHSDN